MEFRRVLFRSQESEITVQELIQVLAERLDEVDETSLS